MDTIYRHVRQALLARGRPEPQQRSTGVGHEIALVRNAAAGVPAGSTPRRAVRRRTWRRRHTWVAAAVALPVAGFLSLPLFFPDESDEPSPFGRTVDPCSLIRPADFARFGDTELDRAYGNFDRCDVLVHRADGGVVDVKVDLDNGQPETTTGATTEGHVRILREPAESDNCTRLLLPAGTDAMVSVSAKLAEDGSAPLCDIADQATERAVSVLNKGLLTPRSDFPAGSLAHEKACALLDAKALETVPGIDADDPDEGYGNFSCDWHSTTSDLDVELRFDRGQPLSAADGTLTRIEGRRALIQPAGEGEDTCLVRVEQRTFRNDQTRTQAETLNLFVAGDRSEAELCRMATALATAGAARVPRA